MRLSIEYNSSMYHLWLAYVSLEWCKWYCKVNIIVQSILPKWRGCY